MNASGDIWIPVGPETSGTSMKHEAQVFVSSELTDKKLEKIQHCCLPVCLPVLLK